MKSGGAVGVVGQLMRPLSGCAAADACAAAIFTASMLTCDYISLYHRYHLGRKQLHKIGDTS